MHIGDLAKRAGTTVRAIRYYEEFGLLHPEGHSAGGFRLYGEEHLKRLNVIHFLKELGLTLTQIREIFTAKKSTGGDRDTVDFLRKVFREKLEIVNDKLESLSLMKTELINALKILQSCHICDHEILLDTHHCAECSSLEPRDSVPETFEILLQ